MANWLKEELAQSEEILKNSIKLASFEINTTIEKVGRELSEQRSFTKGDLKELVDYAMTTLDEVIDRRVSKARKEIALLILVSFAAVMAGIVVTWIIFRTKG
jgi:hypothetical protein